MVHARALAISFLLCLLVPFLLGCEKPLPQGLIRRNGLIIRVADRAVMTDVEAGPFLYGAEGQSRRVDGFYIDRFEVTNRQYLTFVQATDYRDPEFLTDPERTGGHQPVTGITWLDASAYAAWAGARLPTEAEWEKAARGTDARPYPWGREKPDQTKAVLGAIVGRLRATTVGSVPAGVSPYGCLDMSGNLWEWCADWYDRPGGHRVIRGGSFGKLDSGDGRCYSRGKAFPEFPQEHIGFRCVVPHPVGG